jgi:GTPase
VIFVANKVDTEALARSASDFFRLGYGEPICVSAGQKLGKDELFDAILQHLPCDADEQPPAEAALKLAIVGRQNVGKSTFINSLAESDRVIVSEVPGTTRDSIDVRFERDGKAFLAIDTAGVRKKQSMATNIDFYSFHRAERSIRRSDVVLHFFDARHRIGRVDKQLAEYIVENHKPAIFVVNKWDLVKDVMPTEKMGHYFRTMFPMLEHVPIAFITATKGKNLLRLLQLAIQLHKQAGTRVGTGDLNRVVRAAVEENSPPMSANRQPKIYYATQIGIHPPTIILFTNGPELFEQTYIRYLTKVMRDRLTFGEVAIKVVLRARSESKASGGGTTEEAPLLDNFDDAPIVRKKAKGNTAPLKAELIEEPEIAAPPRKRKKADSQTWEF